MGKSKKKRPIDVHILGIADYVLRLERENERLKSLLLKLSEEYTDKTLRQGPHA